MSGSDGRPSPWARWHRVVGLAMLLAFVLSGQVMRHHEPPLTELGPERRLMFLSRHIHLLAVGVAHLLLGLGLRPAATGWPRRAQRGGSLLLLAAALLSLAAFVHEPLGGRPRTPVSTLGLYALFGGTVLHGLGGWRQRPR